MTPIRHPYRPPADLSRFYVITPISNPRRFARRYELYFIFKNMCEAAGVNLITIEQAFGDRQYMVTHHSDPMNIQVRTVEELWHKENMINIAAAHAAKLGAREIAWVDADVRPLSDDRTWFEETWHALQHYEFAQMWETLVDLDLRGNVITTPQKGFMANYVKLGSPDAQTLKKMTIQEASDYSGGKVTQGKELFIGHPGGAWAANMSAFNAVGGLIDYAILGSADHYMAYALLGTLAASRLGVAVTSMYEKLLLDWQKTAEHFIKRDVGFVHGTISHDFHGPKAKRGYSSRWRILTDNNFDPHFDIKKDAQGLLQLNTIEPRQIKIRDQIRAYFANRQEDSTEGGYGE